MAKLAFDNAGEFYANITGDSRVKMWDVATGSCCNE
jgi:hypothetical protein